MASHYVESLTDEDDLHSDLQRIKYIKRLLSKYSSTGTLKTRLIINHLVVLMNTLGPFATTRVMLYKVDNKHQEIIITFLNELNALGAVLQKETTIDYAAQALIRQEMR